MSTAVMCMVKIETRCWIPIWRTLWRIPWHVIPEPRITLQGAATCWIHCHDSRATCHIAYGVRGNALNLVRSYLSNLQQYVDYNGVQSSLLHILTGVPQGSILGPLLFLIYINDIINVSKFLHLILFAHDTNIFLHHSDLNILQSMSNVELDKLSGWFKSNRLFFKY